MDSSEATIWRDDSYCETIAQFKDALRSGATPTDAAKSIWAECRSAPDCDIVALALADSLWHFSALDEAMAAELLCHDYEDKIRRYLIELETSPRTIRTYLASVQKRSPSVYTPCFTARDLDHRTAENFSYKRGLFLVCFRQNHVWRCCFGMPGRGIFLDCLDWGHNTIAEKTGGYSEFCNIYYCMVQRYYSFT